MNVELPEGFVEAVAVRVAEMLASHDRGPEGWVGVAEAAEHLACPRSRIYSLTSRRGRGALPHRKDGSRLLFKRSELDAWVDAGGGTRL